MDGRITVQAKFLEDCCDWHDNINAKIIWGNKAQRTLCDRVSELMFVLNQHYQTQNGKINAAQLQYFEMTERVAGLRDDSKFMWKEFSDKIEMNRPEYFDEVHFEAAVALDRVPPAVRKYHKQQKTDESEMFHENKNRSVHFGE